MSYQLGSGITISPAALQQIVVHATESVVGARIRRQRRGLEVTVADGHVRVEIELAVQHDVVLPDVARAVQTEVAAALRRMSGLQVSAVDVTIEELV
jgi:uncharacterized alkaline shock family protein YloU